MQTTTMSMVSMVNIVGALYGNVDMNLLKLEMTIRNQLDRRRLE